MMGVKKKLFLVVLTAALALSLGHFTTKTASAATWRKAYQVAYAFSTGWEPHYGAWFSGYYGSQYYFSGYTGSPPSPNW
jgi:hypothetical protein